MMVRPPKMDLLKIIMGVIFGLMIGSHLGAIDKANALHHIDPRPSMWLTFANQTNQSSFCIAMQSVSDPFRICLMGMLCWDPSDWKDWVNNTTVLGETMVIYTCDKKYNCNKKAQSPCCEGGAKQIGVAAALVIEHLNVSLPWDPQELDLLGSMRGNGSCSGLTGVNFYKRLNWTGCTNVSSSQLLAKGTPAYDYKNKDGYCNGAIGLETRSSKWSL